MSHYGLSGASGQQHSLTRDVSGVSGLNVSGLNVSGLLPERGGYSFGAPASGLPSPTTDAVLQKCRETLELQARDLERERKEKLQTTRQLHELENTLMQEKTSHHLTSTRLSELEKRLDQDKVRQEDNRYSMDAKMDDLQKANQELGAQ